MRFEEMNEYGYFSLFCCIVGISVSNPVGPIVCYPSEPCTVTAGCDVLLLCQTETAECAQWKQCTAYKQVSIVETCVNLNERQLLLRNCSGGNNCLFIHKADVNDSGKYTCVADDGASEQEFSFNLVVLAPMQVVYNWTPDVRGLQNGTNRISAQNQDDSSKSQSIPVWLFWTLLTLTVTGAVVTVITCRCRDANDSNTPAAREESVTLIDSTERSGSASESNLENDADVADVVKQDYREAVGIAASHSNTDNDLRQNQTTDADAEMPCGDVRELGSVITSANDEAENGVVQQHQGFQQELKTAEEPLINANAGDQSGSLTRMIDRRPTLPDAAKRRIYDRIITTSEEEHKINVDDLPCELKELIALQCFAEFYKKRVALMMFTAEEVVRATETALPCSWLSIIKSRRYKRRLSKFLKRVCKPFSLRPRLICQFQSHTKKPSVVMTAPNEITVTSEAEGELTSYIMKPQSSQAKPCKFRQQIIKCHSPSQYFDGKPGSNRYRAVAIDDIVMFVDSETKTLHTIHETWGAMEIKAGGEITMLDGCKGNSLSVNPDGSLLIVKPRALGLYKRNGEFIRHIELKANIYATHAVAIDNDTFIVCHSSPLSDSTVTRDAPMNSGISIFNANGEVQYTFGDVRGKEPCRLNYPSHLARISDKWILVSDSGNKRVMLLSTDLKFERILLFADRDQLGEPYRLSFLAETGRLAVAMTDGRINIYDILQH